jgi:hypothetical protein
MVFGFPLEDVGAGVGTIVAVGVWVGRDVKVAVLVGTGVPVGAGLEATVDVDVPVGFGVPVGATLGAGVGVGAGAEAPAFLNAAAIPAQWVELLEVYWACQVPGDVEMMYSPPNVGAKLPLGGGDSTFHVVGLPVQFAQVSEVKTFVPFSPIDPMIKSFG